MHRKLTALLSDYRESRLSQESPPCFDQASAAPDHCSFHTYKEDSAATGGGDFDSFTQDRRVNSNPFMVTARDANQELKVADYRQGSLISQKYTDEAARQSLLRGPKDMSSQDGNSSQVQGIDHIPTMRRQQSDYQPRIYSESKDRPVRRSLGGGPLIAKNHQLGLVITKNQREANSQLQQNFYKDSMEQNFNGGGGGSSTNVSNNPIRQHNSDFMYLQRQHQMLSPKAGGIDMSAILESSQGHPAQLGLMPFKQMSEPTNNMQGNFGGLAKYQIPPGGGAPMFTERSSLFSQGTQVPTGGNGVITQYSRPKTNSPFPPFGQAGATAQSTRSAQKAAVSQNPLHHLGPFVPLTGDQLQDSSNSVPLVSQAPILNFPNMDQVESEDGGNPLLLRRHHFNSRGSRVQPQQQLQPQISDLNNTYSTSGGDNLSISGGPNLNGSIGINPQNYNAPTAARSFHLRNQSRDVLRIQVGASDQQIQPQFPGGQQQFMGNFNIGGTWTASSIIMSGPLNQNLSQGPNIMPVNAHSEAQSQSNAFHQLNDSYGAGNGTGGRQSPKTSSEQSRNPYINEVNYQEQDQTQQQQSYGFQRGHYNSESKPQRRQQPEVQIPNLNPQFQQSQQVFMQNNFFIQQMLSSPSNHQLRHQGTGGHPNPGAHPQNTHQQHQPSFDASMHGGTNSSNAFFDLMEMSSVLSSSGLVMGGNESANMVVAGGYQQQQSSQVMQREVAGQAMGQHMSKEQLRIQVPKDISSRQSTQSRVRMNRLNKMMAASSSQHATTQQQQDNGENDLKQDVTHDLSGLQATIQGGILGSSFAHSYQSETSSQHTRQPIWMQGTAQDLTTPEVDSQMSYKKHQNRQKLSLLNQSYRDLHQNELLSQSIIANTKIQLTPQQAAVHHAANQVARVNIGDFSQFNMPQPDITIQGMVNTNRNISGSRRQLHMIPSSQNESSGSGRDHHSQKRFTSNDAAAQSMILNSHDAQLLIQPILNHHHSASESQPRVIDETTFHSTGLPGAGSRESSQSNRQSTFCIEMGKAKPKILKNSLSSAYQVFMPVSTKASSRGGNHRVFQGSEVQTSQGSRKNLEPMTQQNSPKRQGSKMKQQNSIQHRDSLATHSQRANEFSPTNPSYYITFNQDSHIENHKFNPVPNLIGTTGGLIGSSSGPGTGVAGPRTRKQSSISPNDNGKNSSETRRSRRFNPNTNLTRSDSKTSSHSKSRGELGATLSNNFLIKSRPNIRRVEVPSLPTNVTPLGGGCETPDEQEIVVKSANIIGINRKIKINRIVNRNQQPLPGTNTQVVHEVANVQEVVPTTTAPIASTKKPQQQDSLTKLAQHRSRMPSFDGSMASSSKQRSQDQGIVQGGSIFKQVAVPHPVGVNDDLRVVSDEPPGTGAGMRSPQRHNQSQIIEPIGKGQFGTNRIGNQNGGSQNSLAQIAGGHVRRQSQQVPMNASQNQMLPPRHRSQQKINFSSRQESSAEHKVGSQGFPGQTVKAPEMNGTFSLLQQNQNQIRLPSQELPIQNTGSFPSIMKQASQTKFEFIASGENLSGSVIPMDRTASFQPPVVDHRTLTSNSSQSSLHHRRSSRGFQGLTNASQQPQLMLASTYELSNGPSEIVKQQPSVFSPQGTVRGGSMMRKRRLMPSNSRETSANARNDISERSASNRRLQVQHQNDSSPNTATFSQLVLAQQRIEQQAHTQSSPPLNSLDSSNSKGNFHYETPRIGAASIRQQQQMPRTMKEQQPKIMRKQAHTTSGSSPVRQSEEAPNNRMLTRKQ